MYSYQAKIVDDKNIRDILQKMATQHKRYGFKKLFAIIRKQGHIWNHKRVYRIYCALKLNLRKKPKKRLPTRNKVSLVNPFKPNICWSLDYMSDALMYGKRFRTLNVIDDFNREALIVKASICLPAKRVLIILEQVARERGFPQKIRMDNGPENISKEFKQWATKHQVILEYIQPGKPAQNGFIERFNRTYREEVLDMHLFRNIQEVQQFTDQWVYEYNNFRPHHTLGNLTPIEYASG